MSQVNIAAVSVAAVAALAGIRFIVTYRHNNDLYFTFKGNPLSEIGIEQTPGLAPDDEELNGDAKYSSPGLILTLGIGLSIFAVIVLFVPQGVNLISLLHH
jgi:hypothetical protein